MYTSLNVHNRLQELDVPHELFKLAGQAASLDVAAVALGLEPCQIAKVELFRSGEALFIVIVPGGLEVDLEKLESVSGLEEIEPVPQAEIPSLTGYLSNALPPVGHKVELPSYIDYYTLREDVVYTGSGEPTAILKIRSYDLVRATGGEIVDVVIAPPGERQGK